MLLQHARHNIVEAIFLINVVPQPQANIPQVISLCNVGPDRSSHRRCSVRKGVIGNFTKFTENTSTRVSLQVIFLINVPQPQANIPQAISLCNVGLDRSSHRRFSVKKVVIGNFTKFTENTSTRVSLQIIFLINVVPQPQANIPQVISLCNVGPDRSSHRRFSVRKVVIRDFTKFTENTCTRVSFFNKVAGLKTETLLKKRLWHRCFPVSFAIFLRTPFSQNTSRRLLLTRSIQTKL